MEQEQKKQMTLDEFIDKWALSDKLVDDFRIIDVFDILYLEYTKEQVLEMVAEYYDHADEIYNDTLMSIFKHFKPKEE